MLYGSHQDSDCISFKYIPRHGIAALYGSFLCYYLKNLCTVFQSDYHFTFPVAVYKKFLFSISWSPLAKSYIFDNSHLNRYKVIFWCLLIFIFIWWLVMLNIFSCICLPFKYILWENICSSALSIFILEYLQGFSFLLLSYVNSSCIFDVTLLPDMWFADIFYHSINCLLILLIVSFAM